MFRVNSVSCQLIFYYVLIFCVFCGFVTSDPYANLTEINSSERNSRKLYHHRQRHRKPVVVPTEVPLEGEVFDARIPKLFSFQALDEDLTIDLEFAVPFIHVPVKKGMQKTRQAVKSLVNLNTPALVLAGLLVAGSGVFGLLFNNYVGKTTNAPVGRTSRITDFSSVMNPFKLIQRSSEGEKIETAFGNIVEIVEDNFNKNNVDITACIQKSICLYVRKSAEHVRSGRATGTNKIIDGLASSDWLLRYLEGTAVRDAIDSGIATTNCGYKYPTCQWSNPETHVMNLMLGLVQNIPAVKEIWS